MKLLRDYLKLLAVIILALSWLSAPTDIMLINKSWDSLYISWTIPVILNKNLQSMINQHLVSIYNISILIAVFISKKRFLSSSFTLIFLHATFQIILSRSQYDLPKSSVLHRSDQNIPKVDGNALP